ncbi:MAG TPA: SHOCT domain-containing protein [Ktedonobacteraceae bacterium]|nr:SHOCT domain-containing protein [Ktedonobacteraceae bacterium]
MPPTGPLGSGPLWGGPFMGRPFMRRRGFPLLPIGGFGWGMGGMGGMGGGGLLGDLMAGGIGYMMGRRSGQQYQQPQYQPPQYQPPPQQYQQPQTPQYQPPQQQYQQPAAGTSNETLAQLKLLGHLRDSGRLTNDEFEAEKQKILHGY